MSPTTLLRTTSLLVALSLPLSANALMLNVPRKATRDTNQLQYASSSSRRNVLASSASSAPYLNTIRSKEFGLSFKAPDTWKTNNASNGVYIERKVTTTTNTSSIVIQRRSIPKNQEWTVKKLYNTFIQAVTLDSSANTVYPDTYLPSFSLTSSGTIKVAGQNALSLVYTGESRSATMSFRNVKFISGSWVYTVYLQTFPQYAKEDGKVFEGVVGSLMFDSTTTGKK